MSLHAAYVVDRDRLDWPPWGLLILETDAEFCDTKWFIYFSRVKWRIDVILNPVLRDIDKNQGHFVADLVFQLVMSDKLSPNNDNF